MVRRARQTMARVTIPRSPLMTDNAEQKHRKALGFIGENETQGLQPLAIRIQTLRQCRPAELIRK